MGKLYVYTVYDSTTDDEFENDSMLIVAHNWREALGIWKANAKDPSSAEPVVNKTPWKGPGPAPALPSAAQVWYPKEFRGYGFHEDGDHHCGCCDSWVEYKDWDYDAEECTACADDAITEEA